MAEFEAVRNPPLLDGQTIPAVPLAVLSGGRGSGKTFSGSRWLVDLIDAHPGREWAVIGPTFGDARDTNLESGESGILRLRPEWRKGWNRSHGELHLPDGGKLWIDGALDGAERVQGKNLSGAWVDEIGLTRGPRAVRAWRESIRFAVRKAPARQLVTGTPKRGNPLVREIEESADHVVRLRTRDNPHLDPATKARWLEAYENTRLGKQELEGILLPGAEGARWQHEWLDRTRVAEAPDPARWVVGVDPAAGSGTHGIVSAAITPDQHVYVVDDWSTAGTPEHVASKIGELADKRDASVVVERNQGGDWLRATLAAVGVTAPIKLVRAMKSKDLRADPVALLWERGEAHIVGTLPHLETQLVEWVPGDPSPDRLDAMVWAVTHLRPVTSLGQVEASLPQVSAQGSAPAGSISGIRTGGFRR